MGKSGCTDWVESRTGSPRLSQAKDIAEVSSTIYRLWFEPSLDEARLRHLHHLLLFAIGRARATVQRPHVMRLLQYQKSGFDELTQGGFGGPARRRNESDQFGCIQFRLAHVTLCTAKSLQCHAQRPFRR